jgi:hypothetical protein
LPEAEASDATSLARLRKLLAALDVGGDGVVSRRDMLLAFRRDRQLADHLKMPPRIKVSAMAMNSRFQICSYCTVCSMPSDQPQDNVL